MSALVSALPYIEAGLAILLVISILLQQTGAGLGGALGDGMSAGHHTRRGAERFLFLSTIVLGIIFALTALGIFLTS
jgi:preprotein translocase subunit SecG